MSTLRIRAVIVEGECDPATIAMIAEAMESPELTVLHAPPRVADIVDRAAEVTGLSAERIRGPQNCPHVARVRFAVSWVARYFGRTQSTTGRAMGDRDPSTILYQLGQADRLHARDAGFRAFCWALVAYFEEFRP